MGVEQTERKHLLVVDDLTRRFRRRGKDFDAVSHVDLVMDEGDFVAIVGRSGNGKSTLISMIAGLIEPTSGTVRVDGEIVGRMDDRTLSRLRNQTIGFVMQSQTLLSNLTVLDNVVLPATLFDDAAGAAGPAAQSDVSGGEASDAMPEDAITPDPLNERAMALLERLGVADLAGSYPKELSGGEMRRVSIARALMNGPRLLIADEPTGDLDQESTEAVMNLLRGLADEGTAVLMVTHDSEALGYADYALRMDAGVLSRP
ncbi:MAG: ABC transporter ATP-binding protein [Bifidobacterium merycicum]|nr:ABC transporter ATP-binding protein [Bifidobacterium merycicum]